MISFIQKQYSKAILTVLLLLIAPLGGWADYMVEPLKLELKVPENKKVITTSLVVRNTGADVIRLKAYANNWTLDPAGGLQILEGSAENGISDMIRYNPKEFNIAPHQAQVIRLAISFPADAKAGEYRGMLFFEDEKTQSQRIEATTSTNARIEIKQRLGVTTYVYKGLIHSQPSVQTFSVQPEAGKLQASIHLLNSGNRHYRGIGSILLSQIDAVSGIAKPVREIPISDYADVVVLPGTQRNIQQVLWPDREGHQLPAGRYRAELVMKTEAEAEMLPITASTEFNWP